MHVPSSQARAGGQPGRLRQGQHQFRHPRQIRDPAALSSPVAPHGTTIVACALRFDSAVVSNAGDSRCYSSATARQPAHPRPHHGRRAGPPSASSPSPGRRRRQSPSPHALARNELFVPPTPSPVNIMARTSSSSAPTASTYVSDAVIQAQSTPTPRSTRRLRSGRRRQRRRGYDNISVQLIRIREVERMGLTADAPTGS